MAIPVLRDSDLCTLADVGRRLGVDTTQDNDTTTRIGDAIMAASDLIAQYCDRVFEYSAAVVDVLPGDGTLELIALRPPIWHVNSVSFDGAPLSTDEYEVLGRDAKAGIIVVTSGVRWTAGIDDGGVGRNLVTGHERRTYGANYVGGWLTPTQATPAPNTYNVERLPALVTRAAMLAAIYFYLNDAVDPTLSSERLMSYGYTRDTAMLGESGLPVLVERLLGGFRLVPVV